MQFPTLKQELRATAAMINEQIMVVSKEADRVGVPANTLRTPNGDYLLIPLLCARASVLSALANLEK